MTATFTKVEAGDIEVGQYVARARTHIFEQVAGIRVGAASVRLLNEAGQTIARPRKTAVWWKTDAEGVEQADAAFVEKLRKEHEEMGVQALDAKIERLEHWKRGDYGPMSKHYALELRAAQAEWARRFPEEVDPEPAPQEPGVRDDNGQLVDGQQDDEAPLDAVDVLRAGLSPSRLCVRCKKLPREFGDLCEPCWEIGRDEPPTDIDYEEAI